MHYLLFKKRKWPWRSYLMFENSHDSWAARLAARSPVSCKNHQRLRASPFEKKISWKALNFNWAASYISHYGSLERCRWLQLVSGHLCIVKILACLQGSLGSCHLFIFLRSISPTPVSFSRSIPTSFIIRCIDGTIWIPRYYLNYPISELLAIVYVRPQPVSNSLKLMYVPTYISVYIVICDLIYWVWR